MNLRHTLAATTAAVALVSLAACGSSSSNTATGGGQPTSQPTSQASGQASGGGQAGGFAGRNPGTSGKIAAISGKTLQVQNQTDGQVAVTYTGKTAITAQVAAALKDVKVGSCVTVTPVMSASGAPSAKSDAAGSTGPLAAGNVRISQPTNGDCTGGLGTMRPGGAASGFPSGRPSNLPSNFPSNMPSGFGSGGPGGGNRGGFAFGANGKVTAVSGSGFTVESSLPGRGASAGTSSATSSTVTVTVSGSTTYTTTKPGDASALKVGKCVTATGQSDDTGAVAADRLVVSDPVSGSCTGGFAIRGGRGTGGQAGQGAGSSDGGAA